MRKLVVGFVVLGFASVVQAAPISIYTVAGANTYANTENNPCVFFGPGQSGCNKNPTGWTMQGDTGGGDPFNPNPLSITYGDDPGELALFANNVGANFLLGLDINDTSTAQFLNNTTINFFNSTGTNIGNYTFSGPLAVPNSNNGEGFADYVLSAGCNGTTTGSGNTAQCSSYTPFTAPAGTREITFTFGLTGFNDGPDKLFLIGLGGTIPPGDDEPPDDDPPAVVPEPASMVLLGTGLLGLAARSRRKLNKETK